MRDCTDIELIKDALNEITFDLVNQHQKVTFLYIKFKYLSYLMYCDTIKFKDFFLL